VDSTHSQSDTYSQLKAGKLQGSTHLKLCCGLTTFPQEIYDLADTLEILDLTGNALSSLPDDFDRLKNLRILFCSSNQFTQLPEVLGKCTSLSMIGFKANQISHVAEHAIPTQHLRWFILTDNALTKVPASLGECKQLQKLMLAGNQLSTLPDSIANCDALELLRISANQFESLPTWLFNLPKLKWLAYAGNPFSNTIETSRLAAHTIQKIDWQRLTLHDILGGGASGITYQATLTHKNAVPETVAVKLFKGALTSDGLPSCEMHANVLASSHTNLVGIIGVITNHPDGTLGLVMPLLNVDLTILADPPNFATCSRDVYTKEQTFTLAEASTIITGIASATLHLHQQGLMHGDLYAHNILWHKQKSILSDLGGASFLPQDESLANQLQQIESSAFGTLLEELLIRSPLQNEDRHPLWKLQKACTANQLSTRPLFQDIVASLQSIHFT
jgi:Protein tyrosine and serine/threonine kinase/Leucine rich repeat